MVDPIFIANIYEAEVHDALRQFQSAFDRLEQRGLELANYLHCKAAISGRNEAEAKDALGKINNLIDTVSYARVEAQSIAKAPECAHPRCNRPPVLHPTYQYCQTHSERQQAVNLLAGVVSAYNPAEGRE